MGSMHLVRIGSCGSVGHYVAGAVKCFDRGTRVVCRTQRGLEAGEVLAAVTAIDADQEVDGDLVRQFDANDAGQLAQQAQTCQQAVTVCQELLDQSATPAVVVDAVLPLDGQCISFYVLGPPTPSMTDVARAVGTRFDVDVQFRSVTDDGTGSCGSGGCGDGGCGDGGGCSTGGCAGCPAAE